MGFDENSEVCACDVCLRMCKRKHTCSIYAVCMSWLLGEPCHSAANKSIPGHSWLRHRTYITQSKHVIPK